MVDTDSQLIVTAAVSPQASDQGQLPRLLDAVQTHYGHTPHRVLDDASYRNERDLQELEARGMDGYVALGREGRTASGRSPRGPATRRIQTKLHPPKKASKPMPSANGWWKPLSAGLSGSWAFANSGCAAYTRSRASGTRRVWL